MGHVLFFFNPWSRYHGVYGVFYGAMSVAIPLAAFNNPLMSLNSSYNTTSGHDNMSSNDDPSPTDWQSVEIACVGLLVCFWYSLETHVVVWKRHRFRFEQHQDCFFVMLCFAYADIWNALAKCRFFVTKSSETKQTRSSLVRPTTRSNPDNDNLPADFRLFSSTSDQSRVNSLDGFFLLHTGRNMV